MKKFLIFFIFISIFTPVSLLAHGSHGTGFMAGFTHPVFGLDHLVAILGMALIGFSFLKEKSWLPSLAFILAMLAGGLLGIHAEALSITEWIITLSVVIVGAILALDIRFPAIALILLFAFFGFFHGHAHGVEMPDKSNIPLFVFGFIVGASVISAFGWGITKSLKNKLHLQLLGAVIAGMGIMMMLG